MKNIYIIVFVIFIVLPIFSFDNNFTITTQEIEITYFSESKYNNSDFYNENISFTNGFEVYSKTKDVKIFINGKLFNSNRVKTYNYDPGTYNIKIVKKGYDTVNKWMSLEEGERIILVVKLARQYGYLEINSNVSDYDIFLNDVDIKNQTEIPTGLYNLKIRSFGYKEEERSIIISKDSTLILNFDLEVAEFKIENIQIEKPIFNPKANGGFKYNDIEISVTAPSNGKLELLDINNTIIFTTFLKFENWDTIFIFNGLDANNNIIPDGLYKINIIAEEQIMSSFINIDSNLFTHNIPIFRGFSGLATTPTAETNPHPTNTTTFSFGSKLDEFELDLPFSFQGTLTNNIMIHTGMDFKLNFLNNDSNVILFFGLFNSYNLGSILLGLNFNYEFNVIQYESIDTTTEHDFIVNMPMTLKLENYYISLAPEFSLNTNLEFEIGSGIGFNFDNQKTRIGLSGRIDYNLEKEMSALSGFEIYHLIPNSQSFAGLSIISDQDFNLSLLLNTTIIF